MKTAIELVQDEQKRVREVEGYTQHNDDGYTRNQLALAAICYALPEDKEEITEIGDCFSTLNLIDEFWPWGAEYFKYKPDRIRMLTKAASLLVFEIDRLIRLQEPQTEKPKVIFDAEDDWFNKIM